MHSDGPLPTINWWTMYGHAPPMGWFLVDFSIFILVMVWATRRPLRTAFRTRHVEIRQAVANAAAAHARASQEQKEARAKLLALEAEIAELAQTSRRDGELERDRALAEAELYGETLRRDSASVADQELKRARLRLRQRLVTEIMDEARGKIHRALTMQEQERLIDRAIVRLEHDRPMSALSTQRRTEREATL